MNTLPFKRRQMVGLAISCVAIASSNSAFGHGDPPRAKALPTVSLMDLGNTPHDLGALQGKVVMINFWATWCPPCRAEMPTIERLHQSLLGSDFVVFGINQGESADKIRSKMGIFAPAPTFPLLIDERSEVGAYFGVKDLPTSLIFNKKGQLVGVADGARDFSNSAIRLSIDGLLKQ